MLCHLVSHHIRFALQHHTMIDLQIMKTMYLSFLVTDDFKQVLENYVKAMFESGVVWIYRSPRPLGLIAARNLGAMLATGEVIVCLDSHMEVQHNWSVCVIVIVMYLYNTKHFCLTT